MATAVAGKSEQKQQASGSRGRTGGPSPFRSSAREHEALLSLQQTAGNEAIASVIDSPPDAKRLPPIVTDALALSGQPLDDATRDYMEVRFGQDFGDVRIHADAGAAASADAVGASAYTVGRDIVLGSGQYAPESGPGRRLLAHELAHTVQQGGAFPSAGLADTAGLEEEADLAADNVLTGSVVPNFSSAPIAVQRQQKPGRDHLEFVNETLIFSTRPTRMKEDPPTVDDARAVLLRLRAIDSQGLAESQVAQIPAGWAFTHPSVGPFAYVTIFSQTIGGVTKYGLQGSGTRVARVRSKGKDAEPKDTDTGLEGSTKSQPGTGQGGDVEQPGSREKKTTTEQNRQLPPSGQQSSGQQRPQGSDLTEEERKHLDAIRELMAGSGQTTDEDPKELLRLYQLLLDSIENLTFSHGKGDPWVSFAKFLSKNRDKIEGMLRGAPNGRLTQEKIEKVIAEFGKYIVAQPDEEPEKLETVEDFDKLLKYNPNWQKMSPADRKLLLEYAKLTPDELEKAPIDFSVVTTDMKIGMALKLSKSWPREIAEAAKNAFTDPSFVIMLIVTIGIYVGLWLTPDPSFVTKLAAGTLTVVMLAQFAWQDIYGTAKAWMELDKACAKAKTVPELQAAGDAFARQVGAVGFDILLFIAMWGLGKLAGPKLSKIGAERGVARAEAGVKAAEAKPGSGVSQPATGEAAKVLDKAARPTASATLDALKDLLPDEAAKKGLDQLRQIPGGDMQALRALKSELAKGNDLSRFLSEKAQPADVKIQAKAELLEAKGKLARAKLIEAETIKDPALREAVRTEQFNAIKEILQKAGILDDPKIQKAMQAGDINQLVGELGEAMQRTQLRAKYPASQGYQILSNVEVVQEVPGFDSLAKWQAAERAAGREGNPRGLYEQGGKVWKSLGNADALVAKGVGGGKLQPIEIEEVKTGEGDSASAAARQVAKVTTGFGQVAAGQRGVRIFDRVGKNQLGSDITEKFDLSQVNSLQTSARGPEGKGFPQSLGFDANTLRWLAESLIKNLPPAKLPVIPPVVSPRKKDEEQQVEKKEEVPVGGR